MTALARCAATRLDGVRLQRQRARRVGPHALPVAARGNACQRQGALAGRATSLASHPRRLWHSARLTSGTTHCGACVSASVYACSATQEARQRSHVSPWCGVVGARIGCACSCAPRPRRRICLGRTGGCLPPSLLRTPAAAAAAAAWLLLCAHATPRGAAASATSRGAPLRAHASNSRQERSRSGALDDFDPVHSPKSTPPRSQCRSVSSGARMCPRAPA
jgi:hypothetical protein